MRCTRHDPDANSTVHRANEPLDDDCILISFILKPERFLRFVDDGGDPLASVIGTPKQTRFGVRFEWLARPVGVEAPYHFVHFTLFGRGNRIIARFGQIAWLPIEGLHKTDLVVDNHRLLMCESKGYAAIAHLDAGSERR